MRMMINWTFHHDDYAPFGSDEHIDRTEFYSFLITLIFFFIGFCGNILMIVVNIYILRHSDQGEKRTLENFLLEISAFDLLVLIYHLINGIIRYRSNVNEHSETMIGFINISAVSCKLLTYLIRISTLMSHWLIFLLLLNRIFLVHSKFHRFTTIINAKYAVLGLLFLFTLFNVPPIESISFNENLLNTTNFTLSSHCLMNAEMVDIRASIYSTAVLINVFFYAFVGLILPTICIFILSIVVIRKGSTIWNEIRQHENPNERISLRHDSPILEFLRTYNVSFALAILFVFFSIPSKIFRLTILFASNHVDDFSSTQLLLHAHSHSQTVGHAFELAIYSYKSFVCLGTHARFQSALKYLFNYHHHHHHHHRRLIVDQRTSTKNASIRSRRAPTNQSEDGFPLDVICKQLKINEFDSPIQLYRGKSGEIGLYSQRSSFKTRSSVSSRRTKEDEISL